MDEKTLTFNEFIRSPMCRRNIPTYDSAHEPKPEVPWYSVDKAGFDAALKELPQMIEDCIKGAPSSDSELYDLNRTALSLCQINRSPPVRVALLGAQAAGKSLLICALFDRDRLSLTGANGKSVTSSAASYIAHPRSTTGTDMLHARIRFIDREKQEAMIMEHARNYYYFFNVDADLDDDEGASLNNGSLLHRDASSDKLKDTAQDFFTTLFGTIDAFRDSWNVSAYKSGEFVRLCGLKCDEALEEEGVSSKGIATRTASDPAALSEKIKPFMASIKDCRCLWPLVDGIDVAFHHEISESGVTVIDLPGRKDTNFTRAQHTDEIMKTVDFVFIVFDTVRVVTEDELITLVRETVEEYGVDRVKVILTKIDVLSDNQQQQLVGPKFEHVNSLLQQLDDLEAAFDEEEEQDGKKRAHMDYYRAYLENVQKQIFILDRAAGIDQDLALKFQHRTGKDGPQIIHVSASDYMIWTTGSKITYNKLPALTVEMTGIPMIRRLLYELAAPQNQKDCERHLRTTVRGFMKKIKRTTRDDKRDAGFLVMANDLDEVWKGFMSGIMTQAKHSFQKSFDIALKEILADVPKVKDQLEEKVTGWLSLHSAAFLRVMKCNGRVKKGVSHAQGLKQGCDWSRDVADMLAPYFSKWESKYHSEMMNMAPALSKVVGKLDKIALEMIDASKSNLAIHERTKKKWQPLQGRIQLKITMFMEKVDELVKSTYSSATMEAYQSSNLISNLTGKIFSHVFDKDPEEKPHLPGHVSKKKRYVEPKMAFKKKLFGRAFLDPDDHFIDHVLDQFQLDFDKDLTELLEEHFAGINALLTDFSSSLRVQADITYRPTDEGKAIRAKLSELFPQIEEKVEAIEKMLPPRPKTEDDAALPDSFDGFDDDDDDDQSLAAVIEKISKKRKAEPAVAPKPKKYIKAEPR